MFSCHINIKQQKYPEMNIFPALSLPGLTLGLIQDQEVDNSQLSALAPSPPRPPLLSTLPSFRHTHPKQDSSAFLVEIDEECR